MEVGLPVPLRVGGERQVDARELAGEALPFRVDPGAVGAFVEHLAVAVEDARSVVAQQAGDVLRLVTGPDGTAPLTVVVGLGWEMLGSPHGKIPDGERDRKGMEEGQG